MSRDSRDDVPQLVDDLEATLADLRQALEPTTRRGLPMPPSPRRLLSFTDEYAIPTAISVLEANIRALEMLREVIHVTNRGLDATDSTRAASTRARDVSQDAVDRLERALTDIQVALEEGTMPENPEARTLLTEARALRAEIDERLAESTAETRESRTSQASKASKPIVIPVEPDEEEQADAKQEADDLEDALAEEAIEAELETIREELDAVDDEDDET